MDNLSEKLNKHKVGCFLDGTLMNHFKYADDIVLCCPSIKGLQHLINICKQYGDEYDIIFNEKKSVAMTFRTAIDKDVTFPCLHLDEKQLHIVTLFKYLGHILTNTLSDADDIKRQIRCVYTRGNMLINRFKMCSNDIKIQLFKSYIGCFYTSQLWVNYTNMQIQKLVVAYNNVFRKFMSVERGVSMRHLYVNLGVNNVDIICRNMINSLSGRIEISVNSLIVAVKCQLGVLCDFSIFYHWKKLTYVSLM